jgi:hypothetical protein
MIQRGSPGSARAEVIIVTHKAAEKSIQAALARIASAEISQEPPFILRVEEDL